MKNQLDLLDKRPRWERLLPKTLERLRVYSELSDTPLILAYSGGKDSDVLLQVAKESGIKFEAVYYYTTIDPPEIVAHVREHPEVKILKPKKSMYQLIMQKGLPSALRRWCCSVLKEKNYPGRIVITGVRWAESSRRSKRMMFESSYKCKTQKFLHAIIDWKEDDVWEFLKARGVEVCHVYSEGWKRLGCVCCPLGRKGYMEAERWPKIARGMKRAFDRYCENNPGRIEDKEKMWDDFLHGRLGRSASLKSEGCPLFADFRDGELE